MIKAKLAAWLLPVFWDWAEDLFEDDKFEDFISSFFEVAVKSTKTKFDNEVWDLYKKKRDD